MNSPGRVTIDVDAMHVTLDGATVALTTYEFRVVLGWSLSEIASAMKVPVSTVRSRLRLAKTALRVSIDRDPTASEELGGPFDT